MNFKTLWIDIQLKIRQNRWPFFVLLAFYIGGVVFYGATEPDKSLGNLLLTALGIRTPINPSDFSGFYQISIMILLEVVVFSFLVGVLLERYNPVATSKILAQHQRNHSVVLGYHHLGERIIEYLQEHHKPYALIEIEEKKIMELINSGEPVVLGDFTEEATLRAAGIPKCKEVFFVANDFRQAIVCANEIRALNKKCHLYMRVFEDSFQDYLEQEPWNAFAFSTSHWTMQDVTNWTQGKAGDAIVLGFNHLSQLITEEVAGVNNRKVLAIDSSIRTEFCPPLPNVQYFENPHTTLESLKDICDLSAITQIFVCWKTETHFTEALLLVMQLSQHFPQIEKFVRIFDEASIPIFRRYQATTFSTSAKAFEKLQSEVRPHSALSEKK